MFLGQHRAQLMIWFSTWQACIETSCVFSHHIACVLATGIFHGRTDSSNNSIKGGGGSIKKFLGSVAPIAIAVAIAVTIPIAVTIAIAETMEGVVMVVMVAMVMEMIAVIKMAMAKAKAVAVAEAVAAQVE